MLLSNHHGGENFPIDYSNGDTFHQKKQVLHRKHTLQIHNIFDNDP